MNSYKGMITFAEGYNKSFAEFKEEFGSTHVFKNMHPNEREKELKKAYDIAVSKSTKEIVVKDAEIVAKDGELPATTKKINESSTK